MVLGGKIECFNIKLHIKQYELWLIRCLIYFFLNFKIRFGLLEKTTWTALKKCLSVWNELLL